MNFAFIWFIVWSYSKVLFHADMNTLQLPFLFEEHWPMTLPECLQIEHINRNHNFYKKKHDEFIFLTFSSMLISSQFFYITFLNPMIWWKKANIFDVPSLLIGLNKVMDSNQLFIKLLGLLWNIFIIIIEK